MVHTILNMMEDLSSAFQKDKEITMVELFDYGSVTEEHKKAVLEVMTLAKEHGNDMFAEYLKHKFQIEEPLRVDYKESEFAKACEQNDIKLWLMGWVQDGGAAAGSPHYPVLSITEDIRKIEKLIETFRNK